MKIIIRIIAALSVLIGITAVITGLRVISGFFDPGYQYFLTLVSYNVFMGAVSVIAGIYIWQRNKYALLFVKIITLSHTLVLLSLIIIFKDVISDHSIGAMAFRSIAWVIITVVVWKGNKKLK
jgi:hypothetical protein